jgi:hypothetical protein
MYHKTSNCARQLNLRLSLKPLQATLQLGRPDAAVYYWTYSVVEWLPVFFSEESCKIVSESLTLRHREKQVRMNAYVIMPTHIPPPVPSPTPGGREGRRSLTPNWMRSLVHEGFRAASRPGIDAGFWGRKNSS